MGRTQIVQPGQAMPMPIPVQNPKPNANADAELQRAIAASLKGANRSAPAKHSRQASHSSLRSTVTSVHSQEPMNTDDPPSDAHIRLAIEASLKTIKEDERRKSAMLKPRPRTSSKSGKERYSAPAASISNARKSSRA